MELQMRVSGSMRSTKARDSFGSYLGGLLIWNSCAFQFKRRVTRLGTSSRRIAKGF